MTRLLLPVLCGTILLAAAPSFAACDSDNLPQEMLQAYVTGTQEALNEHGFRAGSVDGRMGPQTRSAIRSYQKAAKLPVDGCVSQQLLDHLNFSQPKVYAPGRR
ncbi:peptidoglycan-binding domain-containing protein [Azospirillum picis]|uniref:Peptidoglycan binding-like domain-containing protein n=1 Tax=Azospirillum picis TaxID=488438 RepID=A0ABU0MR11_9PROT|nr:peptidoglycan-binding domain-containing protein [Azospirillum picis]MBP2302328.1 hypothetical protein [Azospirillum picis]MDQ0535907.1 hypothetical protein [Azospirillum picis]